MAATRIIPLHVNKGKTIAQCLADRTDYSENEKKTENGKYISSYECDPKSCDQEFLLAKRQYFQKEGFEYKGNIIAYQIRQSFKPGEVTPEEANRVGYETAMRWTKGKHAFIVATHTDRAHIHNHIIYNSTNLSCDGKWRNFFFSTVALQRVSDLVCIEHGLSVIIPKPYGERKKYHNAAFHKSLRDVLRADIEELIASGAKSFKELYDRLAAKGYEIKYGKQPAFRMKGNKRFLRLDTLGAEYTEAVLKRRIEGDESIFPATETKRDFDHVLDLRKIIEKNKGENYERWAKRFNLKQVAKSICFIQEHGIETFDDLVAMTDNAVKRFDELSESIKVRQKRLEEIAETKKQIVNYAKFRETYEAYKRSGYSRRFFEANREQLQLHKAAKEFFNTKNITKFPKMKELSDEYDRILTEKKREYAEYKKVKESMQDYMIARQNLETLQGAEVKEVEEQGLRKGQKLQSSQKDRCLQKAERSGTGLGFFLERQ